MRCIFLVKSKQTNCIFVVIVDSLPDKEFTHSLVQTCEKVDVIKMSIKTKLFFEINLNFHFYYVGKDEVRKAKIVYECFGVE